MNDFEDVNVQIVKHDGSDVTVTDVLREIANAKQPDRCIHQVLRSVKAMGLWLPGDP